ncbi:MAG: Uma2 family endonuclease [Planctomycetaceae bacterium]
MATILPNSNENATAAIPLENGDCLSREEFYRRWEAMPNLKLAERIEGVVYMPAAIRHEQHGHPHSLVLGWLGHYVAETPGVDFGDNSSLQIDADNDPQPDAYLFIRPEKGGQCRITEDGYLKGAPELIFEISASSASRDLNQKKTVYRRNGVQEYAVWKVMENEIVWFQLDNGQYVEMSANENGLFKSQVFPGLWLDDPAIRNSELKRVLTVQQTGCESAEHQKFVNQLAEK